MVDVLSIHVWIRNTQTCRSHFKKGNGVGMSEPNQGTIHVYTEMSQENSLHNYHILMKWFSKVVNHM
jgi:hypothetical protein